MIIYKATNLVNGKVYIGQTIRPISERIREHNYTSKDGRFLTYFYRAILKHGKNNFKWETIDKALSQKELDSKEKYWIKFYDSNNKHVGYNNKKGGANGKHLPEARKKISEAGRRPCSQETKDKISKANKGQVPWAKGRRFTKEHRLKIAMSQKARIINHEIAAEIRVMISNGDKCVKIAKHFGVNTHVVYNVKYGKTWRTS